MGEPNSSWQQPVWLSAVKNWLRSAGLIGSITYKKSFLWKANKQKSLLWTKNIRTRHWKSGKMPCEQISLNLKFLVVTIEYEIRMSEEKLNDKFVVPVVKHVGGSIMVWRYFVRERAGNLIQIERIRKKEQYYLIL